ncbi:MAG: family 10 glycosylhydrolase, partial [Muribaculaceae bacterium]|nr:family 10 glycosylhydrolase [Muribaculaceae bacterium]
EAHRLGMKVTASAVILPLGQPYHGWNRGVIYDDSARWSGKTCLERIDNDNYLDIRYDSTKVGAFMNPAIKENCDFALAFMKELVTNYDLDGVALDYCRFPDANSDFSAASQAAFEEYLGETIDNFPADIFTYDTEGERVPGKYYKQWWAWRAKLISDLVKEISAEVKAIRPGILVEYWAASWIHALHQTGQNWASPNSDFALDYPEWGSEEYKATGFAPYLDHFQLGAYLENVWGMDDDESIEFAIERGKKLVGDDCLLLGTIYGENHHDQFADAVYLCLSRSAGLMVFDLYQVQKYDLWAKIKEGIDRAENESK